MTKNKNNKKTRNGRIFEFSLIAVSIVLLVLIVIYSIKLTQGIAKTVSGSEHYLRLEIINASNELGLESKMSAYLNELDIENMEIEIVKTSFFELRQSKETFIINRSNDSKTVNLFADILGLNSDNVQQSELEQNKKQLTATLVLGNDSLYYQLLKTKKELE